MSSAIQKKLYYYKIFGALHINGVMVKWTKKTKGYKEMSEILEITMIVSFGASWPLNVMKSWKAKTTKGKSLPFLCLIFFGYIAGIASKLMNEGYMASFSEKWYVLFFYVLNLIMVGTDLVLYYRNYLLDKKAETENK